MQTISTPPSFTRFFTDRLIIPLDRDHGPDAYEPSPEIPEHDFLIVTARPDLSADTAPPEDFGAFDICC